MMLLGEHHESAADRNRHLEFAKSDLQSLADWLQEYIADEWDSRIEADIGDGNLTEAGLRADRHYESGRCTPLG